MQVDRIEQRARTRCVAPQQRQAGVGDVMSHQQRGVEAGAVLAQPLRQAVQLRRVPDLDPERLQRFGMAAAVRTRRGHEHDVRAGLAQQTDQVELAQRTRVAVRLRYCLVQDQNLALVPMQQRRRRHAARGRM